MKEVIIACLKVVSQRFLQETKRDHLKSLWRIQLLFMSMFSEHIYDATLHFSSSLVDGWVL